MSHFLVLQVLESRALYNLGNVYQARGKNAVSSGLASNLDKASLEDYVRTSLEQATRHYEWVKGRRREREGREGGGEGEGREGGGEGEGREGGGEGEGREGGGEREEGGKEKEGERKRGQGLLTFQFLEFGFVAGKRWLPFQYQCCYFFIIIVQQYTHKAGCPGNHKIRISLAGSQ